MKKLIPYLIAAIIFIVVLIMLRPAPSKATVVAAVSMPAGHVITAADLTTINIPASLLPAEAVFDPNQLVGQTLSVDRTPGDLVLTSMTGEPISLQPNERAIAVPVNDASGLGGLLRVGDRVGVNAVVFQTGSYGNEGAYSKAVIENLRVLYVSPEFSASGSVPEPVSTQSGDLLALGLQTERATQGIVVLAVPTDNQVIVYKFSAQDANTPDEQRTVNALELLSALANADNARISLYWMPENPSSFQTGGLYLPDLVITPEPTPTPTLQWGAQP
jgi:pilus assembly protein CpaB